MKPTKIKTNLNRTELSANEINANKRFKPVYDAVRQRANYKRFTTPKYFTALLLILGVSVLVYVNENNVPAKPKAATTDSTVVTPTMPTNVIPIDTPAPNTLPT